MNVVRNQLKHLRARMINYSTHMTTVATKKEIEREKVCENSTIINHRN